MAAERSTRFDVGFVFDAGVPMQVNPAIASVGPISLHGSDTLVGVSYRDQLLFFVMICAPAANVRLLFGSYVAERPRAGAAQSPTRRSRIAIFAAVGDREQDQIYTHSLVFCHPSWTCSFVSSSAALIEFRISLARIGNAEF